MKNHINPEENKDQLPFQVPENYFEELPDRVMKRCREEERKGSLLKIIRPALSLAALFTGFALIAYIAVNLIDQPNNDSSYKQEDIAEAEHTRQFSSEQDLIKAFTDNQKEVKEEKTDQYINYLLEENIDYGTLIKELKEEQQETQNDK
jgi:hypothetical protein